jgi:activator of HSP90 ATPase
MSDRNESQAATGGASRRRILTGATVALGGLSLGILQSWANPSGDGISHSAEAIHQEPVIKANRKRVYEALTDAAQFHKVTMLGVAMRSGMAKDAKPTEISREVGGAFQLFGGFIVGRQIELAPDLRIVQAWREVTWDPGVYSIVRFELSEQGGGTKIAFDHTGFPQGAADHLAIGWKGNYWEPLENFLTT